ncbi:MAG: tRNA (guanosine(37)-N1)-methyltransferase TrmD [Candidatus Dadabacteria bacterium]|nr:tRNA (guanosine(37)-N1)-methyltransferase TrmD [Candidatus Dadabacteria bacterium]
MIYEILTIFPEFFKSVFSFGVLGRAEENGLIKINIHDIRRFTSDTHRKVDDKPYGGGSGMVLKPDPLSSVLEAVKRTSKKSLVILTSPQGETFSDKIARELSQYEQLILISGRYEGVDERIRELYVDREISIGDYVLTGGEYAVSIIIDAVSRFIPGVLGNESSPYDDSFREGLLEHPHYTRPESFMGKTVPQILLSGNHKEIEKWRRGESIKRTFYRRPDLLDRTRLTIEDVKLINELKKDASPSFNVYIALIHYPVYNKDLKVITTAFTNLDVHDIARAGRTYGVKGFFLVHPVIEQRELVNKVIWHWTEGPGLSYNPTRNEALDLVRIKSSLDEALEEIEKIEGSKPKVIVTDARPRENMIGYVELKERIFSEEEPYLLLFGTGWGIAEEVIDRADYLLKPVEGATDYNHLSVRSAAAIILDRLFSR